MKKTKILIIGTAIVFSLLVGARSLQISLPANALIKELKRNEYANNWAIVLGGDGDVLGFSFLSGKYSMLHGQDKYSWGVAALSPSGQYLAAARFDKLTKLTSLCLFSFLSEEKRIRMNLFDEILMEEKNIYDFAWAPNGRTLMISAKKRGEQFENYESYFYDIKTKILRLKVVPELISFTAQSWSQNDALVYEGPRGQMNLFFLKTGIFSKLAKGWNPQWDKKGEFVIYQDLQTNGFRHYYKIDINGTGNEIFLKQEVKSGHIGEILGPLIWSPDGNYFLFGKQSGFDGARNDLFVRDVNTGADVKVLRGASRLFLTSGSWTTSPYFGSAISVEEWLGKA